LLKR